MSESSNFFSQINIPANSVYNYGGNTWDNPVLYSNFYVLFSSNTRCIITVYQNSEPSPTQSSSNSIKTISYMNSDRTQILSGKITNAYISFSIENIEDYLLNSTTNFYVIYK